MVNQRQAVFMCTMAALAAAGVTFVPGETIIHDVLTKEIRNSVVDRVCNMFQTGEVTLKDTPENASKLGDAKELRRYVVGLVTNWHNKDKNLNAGIKYETKNPGARAGSQDEQIQEMKLLQQKLEAAGNTEGAAKVAQAITSRLEELKAAKVSSKLREVDASKLPAELRDLAD